MARYAYHQSDGNEREIIDALEAVGWRVYKIGKPVDLLIAKNGVTHLVEVKMPKGKLRPSQAKFIAQWPGRVLILRSAGDVMCSL